MQPGCMVMASGKHGGRAGRKLKRDFNEPSAMVSASMTKDRNPQSVGDILKQAGQGATGDLFTQLLPQIKPASQPVKPLSRVQNRLLEPCPEHELDICFQHRCSVRQGCLTAIRATRCANGSERRVGKQS